METTQKDIEKLRSLLWLGHGHHLGALYGDDGEMQCEECTYTNYKKCNIVDLFIQYQKYNRKAKDSLEYALETKTKENEELRRIVYGSSIWTAYGQLIFWAVAAGTMLGIIYIAG